jgi:hypothetical protein
VQKLGRRVYVFGGASTDKLNNDGRGFTRYHKESLFLNSEQKLNHLCFGESSIASFHLAAVQHWRQARTHGDNFQLLLLLDQRGGRSTGDEVRGEETRASPPVVRDAEVLGRATRKKLGSPERWERP